jgi:hypothetical protein
MAFDRRSPRHRPVAQRHDHDRRRRSELARQKARQEEQRFRYFHLR